MSHAGSRESRRRAICYGPWMRLASYKRKVATEWATWLVLSRLIKESYQLAEGLRGKNITGDEAADEILFTLKQAMVREDYIEPVEFLYGIIEGCPRCKSLVWLDPQPFGVPHGMDPPSYVWDIESIFFKVGEK